MNEPRASQNRIREIRLTLGLTLDELAARCDTSNQTISRLELSDRQLTQKWMGVLSVALGVAPGDLLPTTKSDGNPGVAEFVNDLDELAWLRLWRRLTVAERKIMLRLAHPDNSHQ